MTNDKFLLKCLALATSIIPIHKAQHSSFVIRHYGVPALLKGRAVGLSATSALRYARSGFAPIPHAIKQAANTDKGI